MGASLLAPSASAQLAWTEVAPSRAPEARSGHSMVQTYPAYRPMLFGGTDGEVAFGDTWRWDGTTWVELTQVGPPARSGHAFGALHFTDDSALLFGGVAADGSRLGDTWKWNGKSWKELQIPSPGARSGAVMSHDEYAIKTLVLFGGRTDAGLSNETWRFVDGTWSEVITQESPPAREDHQMVYVTSRATFVLFGGRDDQGLRTDVWEFDGSNWIQLADLATPRASAATVFESAFRARLFSFGGDTGVLSNDSMEQLPSGEWASHTTEGAPSPRSSSAVALRFVGNAPSYVLFGGRAEDGTVLGDTWILNPVVLPETETIGIGCGPGAWSLDGGPNLFSFPSSLLGNTVTVSASSPTTGRGVFVVGDGLPTMPIGCGLQVKPTQIIPVISKPLGVGLASASMSMEIPFEPVLSSSTLSAQFMIENRTVAGGFSYSRVLRWVLAE